MAIYTQDDKVKLKLTILKILHKNPCVTKKELQKKLYIGRFIIEEIWKDCDEEGLIMRVGGARKVLTRRGIEYING